MTDEFIAKAARENIPIWKQIVERVKAWLADKGIGELSDEETARAIMRALKSGKEASEFAPRLLDTSRSNGDSGWENGDSAPGDFADENSDLIPRYNLAKKPLKGTSTKPTVAGGALLQPYGRPGGGHHVPAKAAFIGEPRYNFKSAPAIPNGELDRLGVDHDLASGAQQTLYRKFATTGQKLTWNDAESIEIQALIRAGMTKEMAATTVRNAIHMLKKAGVSGPTRIPWGN